MEMDVLWEMDVEKTSNAVATLNNTPSIDVLWLLLL